MCVLVLVGVGCKCVCDVVNKCVQCGLMTKTLTEKLEKKNKSKFCGVH